MNLLDLLSGGVNGYVGARGGWDSIMRSPGMPNLSNGSGEPSFSFGPLGTQNQGGLPGSGSQGNPSGLGALYKNPALATSALGAGTQLSHDALPGSFMSLLPFLMHLTGMGNGALDMSSLLGLLGKGGLKL